MINVSISKLIYDMENMEYVSQGRQTMMLYLRKNEKPKGVTFREFFDNNGASSEKSDVDEGLYQPYSDFSDSVAEHQVNKYATEENVQWNPYVNSTPVSTSISQSALSHLSTPAMLTFGDSHDDTTAIESENVIIDNLVNNGIDFSLEPVLKATETAGNKSSRKRKSVIKPMLKPCECKKRCLTKIDEDRRKNIHEQYWKKGNKEKWTWPKNTIKTVAIRRRKRKAN